MSSRSRRARKRTRSTDRNCTKKASPPESGTMSQEAKRNQVHKMLSDALAPLKGRQNVDDMDHDHLIRSIRALIVTNEEIWDHCESMQCSVDVPSATSTSFQRCCYNRIKMDKANGSTRFEAVATLEKKTFALPWPVPIVLNELSPPLAMKTDKLYPDYGKYLDHACILCADVVDPFLAVLQAHLEKVQVSLGEINTWLLQPSQCAEFIRNHFFAARLPEIAPTDFIVCDNTCVTDHNADDICVKCLRSYSEHSNHCYSRYGINPYIYHHSGCNNRGGEMASFFRPKTHFLKTHISSGEFKETFDISTEAGQERVAKFLDFLSAGK